ncbi:MAG: methyltransferase domain-containing protein, partial [Rhodospirillaceae bacterium]|nr:methyltransferase domain-containing protein [Rhodospirillaceae bacterium]
LAFWRGTFGDAYVDRNAADSEALGNRRAMWRRIFSPLAQPPRSILEVGANIGLNLRALAALVSSELYALEPNAKARAILAASGAVPPQRILDGTAAAIPLADGAVDMAFTSGVLIHIAPQDLADSCRELHRVAGRYIVCAEYFNPTPVEIEYRGHSGYLFKRDFGAFWLDSFDDLELVDYGFFWKRATGLDDLTWWLFRKRTEGAP